jgi:2-polyprenyl-6-methoxyphenol hydroxylase-like FAD-dependent oxidoreductase
MTTQSVESGSAPASEELLVVGGGIAGTALAGALQTAGHRVVLSEDGGSSGGGFAVMLMPNGTRALRELGLLEAAVERGQSIEELSYRDERDELLNTFDLRGVGEPDPWLLIRWQSLRGLLSDGAVGVERVSAVGALDESESGVRASFDDGSERVFGHVVIAEGAGSSLRAVVDPDPEVTRFGHIWRWLIADDQGDGDRPWGLWLGERATFMAFPVGDGELLCQGVVPGLPEPDPVDGRAERVRRRLAAFAGTAAGYLGRVPSDEAVVAHTIQEVRLRRWHSDRVLVIGDAAHAGSSAARQGASQALEDALVLAELSGEAAPGPEVFERFEGRRRARVEAVQAAGRALEARSAHADAAMAAKRDQMIRGQTSEDFARPWTRLFTERP